MYDASFEDVLQFIVENVGRSWFRDARQALHADAVRQHPPTRQPNPERKRQMQPATPTAMRRLKNTIGGIIRSVKMDEAVAPFLIPYMQKKGMLQNMVDGIAETVGPRAPYKEISDAVMRALDKKSMELVGRDRQRTWRSMRSAERRAKVADEQDRH
jgi:hypothetical protein